MPTIRSFEDIECWKKARSFCKIIGIHIDTGKFRNNYRLIQQIEGSAGSIMDNIAEGFERGTRSEFIQFLGYAKGSCGETRSQLYRAADRNYLTENEFKELLQIALQISGMTHQFITYLQKTEIKGLRKKIASPNVKP